MLEYVDCKTVRYGEYICDLRIPGKGGSVGCQLMPQARYIVYFIGYKNQFYLVALLHDGEFTASGLCSTLFGEEESVGVSMGIIGAIETNLSADIEKIIDPTGNLIWPKIRSITMDKMERFVKSGVYHCFTEGGRNSMCIIRPFLLSKELILITVDDWEHLMNCLANQKFNPDEKSQEVIDANWNRGMALLSEARKK